jgi:hypothetical protein
MLLNSKEDSTANIIAGFSNVLEMTKKHHIPQPVVARLLCQLFYFIDVQSFNALLKRTDLFTASVGFQIKMAVSKLEGSISKADKQLNLIR